MTRGSRRSIRRPSWSRSTRPTDAATAPAPATRTPASASVARARAPLPASPRAFAPIRPSAAFRNTATPHHPRIAPPLVGTGRPGTTSQHPPEGNIVNTSSLTAGSAQQSQATAIRAQARQLNERLALRAGLALLAWSRRQDERRTSDAVLLRRQTEQLANEARDDQFRQLALRGVPLAVVIMRTDITEPPRLHPVTMGMRPAGASAAHGGVESAPAVQVAALSSSPFCSRRPLSAVVGVAFCTCRLRARRAARRRPAQPRSGEGRRRAGSRASGSAPRRAGTISPRRSIRRPRCAVHRR